MVFDEVDAGIGGAVAEIVGRELRVLGAAGQVLCVTHLPQVAAQGHQHLRVAKLSDGGSTPHLVEMALDALGADHALKRIGRPDEVAEAIEYLIRAEWTTGTSLVVDGGLSLGISNR